MFITRLFSVAKLLATVHIQLKNYNKRLTQLENKPAAEISVQLKGHLFDNNSFVNILEASSKNRPAHGQLDAVEGDRDVGVGKDVVDDLRAALSLQIV